MAYYKDEETIKEATSTEETSDPRIALIHRLVRLERGFEIADANAEKAVSEATKMKAELVNVRNELHSMLGVVASEQAQGATFR